MTLHATLLFVPLQHQKCVALSTLNCLSQWKICSHPSSAVWQIFKGYFHFLVWILKHNFQAQSVNLKGEFEILVSALHRFSFSFSGALWLNIHFYSWWSADLLTFHMAYSTAGDLLTHSLFTWHILQLVICWLPHFLHGIFYSWWSADSLTFYMEYSTAGDLLTHSLFTWNIPQLVICWLTHFLHGIFYSWWSADSLTFYMEYSTAGVPPLVCILWDLKLSQSTIASVGKENNSAD